MSARDREISFCATREAALTPVFPSRRCRAGLFLFAIFTLLAFVRSRPALGVDAPTTQPATQPAGGNDGIEITSKDGVLTLRLPAGWERDKPDPGYAIAATARNGDSQRAVNLTVASQPQEDFVDFHSFANHVHNYWVRYYENPESTEAKPINIGGRPAIRYDVTYVADGCRMGMVMVFAQTSTRYDLLVVDGFKSTFTSQKDQWAALANGLVENPAASGK
jgi:hypothetical protein